MYSLDTTQETAAALAMTPVRCPVVAQEQRANIMAAGACFSQHYTGKSEIICDGAVRAHISAALMRGRRRVLFVSPRVVERLSFVDHSSPSRWEGAESPKLRAALSVLCSSCRGRRQRRAGPAEVFVRGPGPAGGVKAPRWHLHVSIPRAAVEEQPQTCFWAPRDVIRSPFSSSSSSDDDSSSSSFFVLCASRAAHSQRPRYVDARTGWRPLLSCVAGGCQAVDNQCSDFSTVNTRTSSLRGHVSDTHYLTCRSCRK